MFTGYSKDDSFPSSRDSWLKTILACSTLIKAIMRYKKNNMANESAFKCIVKACVATPRLIKTF